jgi:Putative Ig domain
MGASFTGNAKSVNFSGVTNGIGFDNITIGSQTPGKSIIITSSSLLLGIVGSPYSQVFAASGGTTPYGWSATGLPSGLTLNASTGLLGGTPVTSGTFNVSVSVTDNSSPKLTSSLILPLTITVNTPLTITTTTLTSGTVGSAYSQTLAATGGRTPYSWSATGLPGGLTLNGSTGLLSGIPIASGTFNVSLIVSDSSGAKLTASRNNISLFVNQTTAQPVQITSSIAQVRSSTDQPTVTVSLASSPSVDLIATLTLAFTGNAAGLPSTNYSDPGLQFGQGGATTTLTIPRGSTTSSLPVNNGIQVGSVAGTITVTITQLTQVVNGQIQQLSLPNPRPSTSIVVPKLAPVISSVRIINVTASSFTVAVVASSTPRDLATASLIFSPAPGAQLNATNFPGISLSGAGAWFGGSSGQNAGAAFNIQIPFTFSGQTNAIGSVSVTLANSIGSSAPLSGTM